MDHKLIEERIELNSDLWKEEEDKFDKAYNDKNIDELERLQNELVDDIVNKYPASSKAVDRFKESHNLSEQDLTKLQTAPLMSIINTDCGPRSGFVKGENGEIMTTNDYLTVKINTISILTDKIDEINDKLDVFTNMSFWCTIKLAFRRLFKRS